MHLWNKKIPTLLGIIILVIGVGVTSFLVQQHIIIFQNAAPSDVPQNIRITNISDTAFTVTYTTDASVVGTISLSTDGDTTTQTVLDDRDEQAGVPKPYTIHSISAKDLNPDTDYTFKILSGSTTYLNGDKQFSVSTPSTLDTQPSTQNPLAGSILMPNGQKTDEVLIYVTLTNGQLVSTLLNPSGLYILPVNTMRTKDLSGLIPFTQDTTFQILATNGPLTSHASVGISGTNPVPAIILSQDYDFTIGENPLATSSAQKAFPVFALDAGITATPEIITPKTNESFSDQQPQFKGTAAPNTSVTVTIHSDTAITSQVKTDAVGNWTYRPDKPLTPGQHTITITAPDATGILHTVQQSFTVYAAGSQVNQSATPSATLAPTKTPTKVPTPTSKPIVRISPTPTTPPSQTTKGGLPISPKPTLPPTGSNTVAVVSVAGIATAAVGIVLFLLTTGAAL